MSAAFSRLRYYFVEASSGLVLGYGVYWYFGQRKYLLRHVAEKFEGHREFNETDSKYLRDMKGNTLLKTENPGIRIIEDFITDEEQFELTKELEGFVKDYGHNQIDDFKFKLYSDQQEYLENPPDPFMIRVTGRFEVKEQAIAPWNYGFDLNRSKLPPGLAKCVKRIEDSNEFALGQLLDVTVNYRKDKYFRVDPHLDPIRDGPTVFILPLLSDSVLTLTPSDYEGEVRKDYEEISKYSYTAADVDCLLKQKNLFQMHAEARWRWTHAIRNGTEYEDMGLCDWFGCPEEPIKRNENRYSLIFSFAPAPDFEQIQYARWFQR